MITIHKFPFIGNSLESTYNYGHPYKFHLPELSELLHCAFQGEELFLWAKVNTELALTTKTVYMFGTGWQILENMRLRYINTIGNDPFVWHFFERL